MKNYSLIALLFFLLIISACIEDTAECENTEKKTKYLSEESNCEFIFFEIEEDYVLLTNQTQLDSLITGDCYPIVDFNTYNVVLGEKFISSMPYTYTMSLIQNCNTNINKLSVTIEKGIATQPILAYHAILIPKFHEDFLEVEVLVEP